MGMLITMLFNPGGWLSAGLGFLLFRAFDVVKPYPAGRLEHLHGGVGVMADDAMAAVYANLAWQGFHAAVVLVMALYLLARVLARKVDRIRRVTFDCVRLFWLYTVAQGLVGLALSHLFPHAV